MTAETVRTVFGELRAHLVPLARAISERSPVDDSCLRRDYPEDDQGAFAEQVIRRLGYDFERGRLDRTAHPFMIRFAAGDVRITTRSRRDFLGEQLFSTIHEAGHALYEQGVAPAFDGTPLGGGTSAGVHESQSRLWENLVARSRDFWVGFYPQLQAKFSTQLADVPLEAFYRAINAVRPSLIRTDADEVTYNLHVMLRFELELELLEGRLAIADLPDAWHARYAADLGLRAPDDRDGALQDVHWFAGTIGGAFQGYTLGNIISAQVFQGGAGSPSGDSATDSDRPIRDPTYLVAGAHLPARRRVHHDRVAAADRRRSPLGRTARTSPAHQVRRPVRPLSQSPRPAVRGEGFGLRRLAAAVKAEAGFGRPKRKRACARQSSKLIRVRNWWKLALARRPAQPALAHSIPAGTLRRRKYPQLRAQHPNTGFPAIRENTHTQGERCDAQRRHRHPRHRVMLQSRTLRRRLLAKDCLGGRRLLRRLADDDDQRNRHRHQRQHDHAAGNPAQRRQPGLRQRIGRCGGRRTHALASNLPRPHGESVGMTSFGAGAKRPAGAARRP